MKKIFLVASIVAFSIILSGCGTTTQNSTATKPSPTPHASSMATLQPTPKTVIANPTHIIVPSIHVDAPIENVQIADDGSMAVPTQNPWDGVGWYSPGTRPGEKGSAVIDGHLDRPGGAPAVFWDLHKIQAGDKIIIVDASGITRNFQVTRVASYPPNQAPIQEIFGNSAGTFLNLITCAGDWIPSQRQTTLRFVVYASMI